MDLALKDRNFLVVAASKGLGFSVARELLKEGARVLISSSSGKNLESACSRLKEEGLANHESIVADLSRAQEIEKLIEHALAFSGNKLHGLVTNCGGPPAGRSLEITDEQWQQAFDSVFLSVVRLCRGLVPVMIENGGGSIVAITSTTVKQPIPHLTTSNAIRPGVAGFLKYLSNEVASKNVRVNVVAPGRFQTERSIELETAASKSTGRSIEEIQREYLSEIPMNRVADVSEFPGLCAFLLSDKASYITGQTICNDGGRVATIW